MVEDSKGGKLLVRDVPSIGGGEAQMTIPAAEVCAAAGRNSETMRRDVDEEVLVPLLRATAKEVMGEFKACLKDALVGGTIGSIVCVDGGPEKAVEILKGYPDWECWYTIAPVKGASRIKEKVGEYAKSHWPGVEQLGDCLRAMVVCRRGKKSGDLIYRTWKQLEQAFDIREGHGRLKNNYATAGILEGAKHQKPPDMLMNAVLDVEGCMSMPAEIQVHHEEILELKESKVHLLYEIARAKSIGILRGGAPVVVPPQENATSPATSTGEHSRHGAVEAVNSLLSNQHSREVQALRAGHAREIETLRAEARELAGKVERESGQASSHVLLPPQPPQPLAASASEAPTLPSNLSCTDLIGKRVIVEGFPSPGRVIRFEKETSPFHAPSPHLIQFDGEAPGSEKSIILHRKKNGRYIGARYVIVS